MQAKTSYFSSIFIALTVVGWLTACAGPASPPAQTASPAPQATVAAAKPTPEPVTPPVPDKVVITFPEGGSELTPEANRQLDFASRLFRDANPVVMFSKGYTDSAGNEFSNVLLSARRAEAVKRGLVARGIPADRLLIQALGESEPDNAQDPLAAENRRVVITWRLPSGA